MRKAPVTLLMILFLVSGVSETLAQRSLSCNVQLEHVQPLTGTGAKAIAQCAFFLKSFDSLRRIIGAHGSVSYTFMKLDKIYLWIQASSKVGIRDKTDVRTQGLFESSWSRTAWVYGLYAFIFLAGIFILYHILRRRLTLRERTQAAIRVAELRAEVAERELEKARELEKTYHDLEEAHADLKNLKTRLEEQNRVLENQKVQLREQAQAVEQALVRVMELDAAKSHLFANISHEFRTPLTLLIGPIQDALKGHYGRIGKKMRRDLQVMYRHAKNLQRKIDDILDLTRIEVGTAKLTLERRNFVSFLKRLTQSFVCRSEREDIALTFSTQIDTFPLTFDAEKLEKVFYNLLSNAFKFTPRGGKIHLRIRKSGDETGEYVEVAVIDTGCGIPEDSIPFIFDRFFQVDGVSGGKLQGIGIGLAIAREFVELHNGQISVSSEVGFGTTFFVRLPPEKTPDSHTDPVEDDFAENPEDVSSHNEQDPGDPELSGPDQNDPVHVDAPVILIVEDNDDVRTYLKEHLLEHYRVQEAITGDEGIEAARQFTPDLILLDLMLPGKNGDDVCRTLKGIPELSSIPIILLTARADEESKINGLAAGADDYLLKPFNTRELLVRIENLIEIRRQLREHFSDRVRIGPDDVSVSSQDAKFIDRVREVVEAYIGEGNFGVDRLAEEVGLSTRQLGRKMQSLVKVSPAGYIRIMRLERAAQLLQQDAGTVSEIAYSVGFHDAHYFSRIFSQYFGVSPTLYSAQTQHASVRNPAIQAKSG